MPRQDTQGTPLLYDDANSFLSYRANEQQAAALSLTDTAPYAIHLPCFQRVTMTLTTNRAWLAECYCRLLAPLTLVPPFVLGSEEEVLLDQGPATGA